MKKTRVYQIAEEVGMSNKDILAKIKELGIEVENEKSELEEDDVELILDLIKDYNSWRGINSSTISWIFRKASYRSYNEAYENGNDGFTKSRS